MKRFILNFVRLILILTFLVTTGSLFGKKDGITGKTNSNSQSCGECHAKSPNSSVVLSVSSESGSFELNPGERVKFVLKIQSPNGITAGCNIAVKTQANGNTSVGILEAVANSGLKVSKGELTHQAPKTCSMGTSTFEFYWTAPSSPGTYYLQAVGLASNNNNKEDNADIWNFMPVQELKVKSISSVEDKQVRNQTVIFSNNAFYSNQLQYIAEQLENVTSTVLVFSTDGRTVYSVHPSVENLRKVLSNLPSGIYFAIYQIDGTKYFLKILKQE